MPIDPTQLQSYTQFRGIDIPLLDHLKFRYQPAGEGGGDGHLVLQVEREHLNGWNNAHGGVLMSLLDVAMALACSHADEQGRGCVTVEMKTSFLRPGGGVDVERSGGDRHRLVAREEIEHPGLGRKRQGGGAEPQPFQDQAAILIDGFRRDVLFGEGVGRAALEQHGKTPGAMRVTIIRPAPAEFYFTENYMN